MQVVLGFILIVGLVFICGIVFLINKAKRGMALDQTKVDINSVIRAKEARKNELEQELRIMELEAQLRQQKAIPMARVHKPEDEFTLEVDELSEDDKRAIAEFIAFRKGQTGGQ